MFEKALNTYSNSTIKTLEQLLLDIALVSSLLTLNRFLSTLQKLFNTFHATGLFLYPLKTSENQRFRVVFKGYSNKPVVNSIPPVTYGFLMFSRVIGRNQWSKSQRFPDVLMGV